MRDSFIFYRSFYEAINDLPDNEQIKIYKAICELSLNFNEIELNGLSNTIFKLIKPQLEANNKRYVNGNKGGAPKGNQNATKKQPKNNQDLTKKQANNNENNNDNDNVNDNDNDNINIIAEYQNNIGSCSSYIYEQLIDLEKQYGSLKVQQAIYRAVEQGKRTLNYIKGILNQWGDKSWEQILKDEDEFKKQKISKESLPKEQFNDDMWNGKPIKTEEKEFYISDEDKKRFGIE